MVSQSKNGKKSELDKGKGKGINGNKSSAIKNTSSAQGVTVEPKTINSEAEPPDCEDLDLELEDICEVVISLKCKQCGQLFNDNKSLSRHIRQNHGKTQSKEKGTNLQLANKCKVAGKNNDTSEKAFPSRPPPKEKEGQVTSGSERSKETSAIKSSSSTATDEEGKNQPRKSDKLTGSAEGVHVDDSSRESSYDDVFLCAECDIVFSSRETCFSHMHKVHGLKQFNNEFFQEEIISNTSVEGASTAPKRKTSLPKQFTPESGAVVSKRYRVTKDPVHGCSRCSVKFGNVEVMKFHEKCHSTTADPSSEMYHKKGYEVVKSTGRIQVKEISLPKGFFCPVCESKRSNGPKTTFFSKWAICAWHLWKEHRIDCELYTCSICKQFKSYYIARVKDHEKLHSEVASYKCTICNKTFKQLKQLRSHEKYHKTFKTKLAPEADSRWYTPKECPICQRILSDSKCLKKHISAVHNKLKPYVCNICGHTSARKAELQLHVRQHTGEKPYKCNKCEFQTGDHNSLRKHKLRHGDKRPYACPYCEYKCIQSCAFKKHILGIHPGQEVVYLCQLCSHASVSETVFEAHQKEHMDDDPPSSMALEGDDSQSTNTSSTTRTGCDSEVEETLTRSGDEDSLDIVDNGGVTIPASPVEPSSIEGSSSKSEGNDEKATSSKENPSSSMVCEMSSSQAPEILFEKPNISGESFTLLNSFVVVKGTDCSGESVLILEPCNGKPPSTPTSTENPNQSDAEHEHEHSLSALEISEDSDSQHSVHSSKSTPGDNDNSSPVETFSRANEYLRSQPQDIRGNEDTESTSEVIFNPHQLIQNIELTPLDLSGVFEQSNDEGMLQRLLDMSGV